MDHLPCIKSDHNPILVNLGINERQATRIPLMRFQSCWLLDSRFQKFIDKNWDETMDFTSSYRNFMAKTVDWNKKFFHNLFQNKKSLLDRLRGVQVS